MSVRGKPIYLFHASFHQLTDTVVARVRPLLPKELDKDTIVRVESNILKLPNPKNEAEEFSFTFNSVYDMGTTQEELFTNEGTSIGSVPWNISDER